MSVEAGEAVAGALAALPYKDADDEDMAFSSCRFLEPARLQIMAGAFPELAAAGRQAYAVVATRNGQSREFVAVAKGDAAAGAPELVMGNCQITYEDLTPAECIEYAFGEAPGEWHLAQLCQDALETYRGMKFDAWKGMLVSPTCEAQFRRMLQIGMISQLYDHQVFPTPESLKSKYQVTDERTGKLIELPHPVKALRVWDAATQGYKAVETQLTGAPPEASAAGWWKDFVQELSSKHGAEYIEGLLAGK